MPSARGPQPSSGSSLTRPGLPVPCLMLVTDRRLAGGPERLLDAAAKAVAAGVNVVQLREKDLPGPQLLALARRLRRVTRGRAQLLVNGPLEIANQAGADGVHLPEGAKAPQQPSPFVWGRSVHSLEGAVRAAGEAPRYLIAGPVFQTRSHPGRAPMGLEEFGRIAASVTVPVIAIGGIAPDDVGPVVRAGAAGVAVISAILGQRSPTGAARMLREALDVAYSPTNGARG